MKTYEQPLKFRELSEESKAAALRNVNKQKNRKAMFHPLVVERIMDIQKQLNQFGFSFGKLLIEETEPHFINLDNIHFDSLNQIIQRNLPEVDYHWYIATKKLLVGEKLELSWKPFRTERPLCLSFEKKHLLSLAERHKTINKLEKARYVVDYDLTGEYRLDFALIGLVVEKETEDVFTKSMVELLDSHFVNVSKNYCVMVEDKLNQMLKEIYAKVQLDFKNAMNETNQTEQVPHGR